MARVAADLLVEIDKFREWVSTSKKGDAGTPAIVKRRTPNPNEKSGKFIREIDF